MQTRASPPGPSPNRRKRLVWLLTCVLVGSAIAVIGSVLSGSSIWYLAIPGVVALGWLFLADPTECEPPSRQRAKE